MHSSCVMFNGCIVILKWFLLFFEYIYVLTWLPRVSPGLNRLPSGGSSNFIRHTTSSHTYVSPIYTSDKATLTLFIVYWNLGTIRIYLCEVVGVISP